MNGGPLGAVTPGGYFQGASVQAVPALVTAYALQVDWDGDDDFDGPYEELCSRHLVYGGFCRRGRTKASQLTARAVAGQLEAHLRNEDGLFSSFNISSPLYGDLLAARKVRLSLLQPINRVLWTGYLDRIRPASGGVTTATLLARGAFVKLGGGAAVVSPPHQSGLSTGEIAHVVLDELDWPGSQRIIDAGVAEIGNWFVQDKPALEALQEMEEAENGFLHEGLNWDIVFESRDNRILNHAVSEGIFTDDAAGILFYGSVEQEDPLDEIFNRITAKVFSFTVAGLGDLWTITSPGVVLVAGQSVTFIAEYPNASTSNPAAAYVDAWTTPVVGTDLTQTGVADGDIGVSVSKTATRMFITITNNHGSASATLTLVKARGTAVTRNSPQVIRSEDAASIATFGNRSYPLESPWHDTANDAQSACDEFVSRYKDPHPTLTMRMPAGVDATLLEAAVGREISDRITAVATGPLTELGVETDCFIESIEHRFAANQPLETTWSLKAVDSNAEYWILGLSVLGTNTMPGY